MAGSSQQDDPEELLCEIERCHREIAAIGKSNSSAGTPMLLDLTISCAVVQVP